MTEPLSQDVLEQIGRETAHAAKKATDSRMRHWATRAGVGFALLLAGVVYNSFGIVQTANDRERSTDASQHQVVVSGRAVSVEGCNRDFIRDKKFIRLLQRLKDANDASYKAGRITADQHSQATEFYASQIAAFRLPDCRNSERLLTDNPSVPIVVPEPLYER